MLMAQTATIDFVTDAKVNVLDVGQSISIKAAKSQSLTFTARELGPHTREIRGFGIWKYLSPIVVEYILFPHSAYHSTGGGDYYITHQKMHFPAPNAGSTVSITGGATVWFMHGTCDIDTAAGTQRVVVDQWNYKYFPPVRLDL